MEKNVIKSLRCDINKTSVCHLQKQLQNVWSIDLRSPVDGAAILEISQLNIRAVANEHLNRGGKNYILKEANEMK